MQSGASFDVCAMMREGADVVRRFVSHYRALGAGRILIFYDGALPEGLEAGLDGVVLTACDDAFWASQPEGARPHAVEARQMICYRTGCAASTADWLWIADADEYLTGTVPVAEMLGKVADGVDALRIPTAEAVWGPGDDPRRAFGCTWFRTPMRPRRAKLMMPLLYGRAAVFYRQGLIAHSAGKHFLRRGARVDQIGLHDSFRDGKKIGVWVGRATPYSRAFHVAHFDAVSFPRWAEKWRRRYSAETGTDAMHAARHVQKRMIEAASAAGEAELFRLFVKLNSVSSWQAFVLEKGGHLFHRDLFEDSREFRRGHDGETKT